MFCVSKMTNRSSSQAQFLQMEVEFGRFWKDVWAIDPLKNEPRLPNSEEKLSRHMNFGRKVWLYCENGSARLLEQNEVDTSPYLTLQ